MERNFVSGLVEAFLKFEKDVFRGLIFGIFYINFSADLLYKKFEPLLTRWDLNVSKVFGKRLEFEIKLWV